MCCKSHKKLAKFVVGEGTSAADLVVRLWFHSIPRLTYVLKSLQQMLASMHLAGPMAIRPHPFEAPEHVTIYPIRVAISALSLPPWSSSRHFSSDIFVQ
jgi:hypothetical protein